MDRRKLRNELWLIICYIEYCIATWLRQNYWFRSVQLWLQCHFNDCVHDIRDRRNRPTHVVRLLAAFGARLVSLPSLVFDPSGVPTLLEDLVLDRILSFITDPAHNCSVACWDGIAQCTMMRIFERKVNDIRNKYYRPSMNTAMLRVKTQMHWWTHLRPSRTKVDDIEQGDLIPASDQRPQPNFYLRLFLVKSTKANNMLVSAAIGKYVSCCCLSCATLISRYLWWLILS